MDHHLTLHFPLGRGLVWASEFYRDPLWGVHFAYTEYPYLSTCPRVLVLAVHMAVFFIFMSVSSILACRYILYIFMECCEGGAGRCVYIVWTDGKGNGQG